MTMAQRPQQATAPQGHTQARQQTGIQAASQPPPHRGQRPNKAHETATGRHWQGGTPADNRNAVVLFDKHASPQGQALYSRYHVSIDWPPHTAPQGAERRARYDS